MGTLSWYDINLTLVKFLTSIHFTVTFQTTFHHQSTCFYANFSTSDFFQDRYETKMPEGTWILLMSLTMSMVFIGGLFGSILNNFMMMRLTRKQALVTTHVINIIGRILTVVGAKPAASHELVIIGRFVTGISIGCVSGKQHTWKGKRFNIDLET